MTRALVRVRPAGEADVAGLVDLLRDFDLNEGVFSGRPLVDPSAARLTERLCAILRTGDRQLLVAVDENDGVAGMVATKHDEIGAIDLTPVLHITHLMVAPGQRRRGTGRALLAAAVQLAEQRGTEHVLATAAAGSREGNRYLARIGFAPLVVNRIAPTSVLRRSLGMSDAVGRVAVLRRARLVRAQRGGFGSRAVGRGA